MVHYKGIGIATVLKCYILLNGGVGEAKKTYAYKGTRTRGITENK